MTLSGGSWGRVVEAELTQGPTSTRPGHSVTGPGKKSNFKINTFLRPSQQCQNQTTLTNHPDPYLQLNLHKNQLQGWWLDSRKSGAQIIPDFQGKSYHCNSIIGTYSHRLTLQLVCWCRYGWFFWSQSIEIESTNHWNIRTYQAHTYQHTYKHN